MAKIYESPMTGDQQVWDLLLTPNYLPAVAACAEVGLFEKLGSDALPIEALADRLGVQPVPLGVVLSLVAALGFVEVRQRCYALTDVARTYLVSNSPFYWGALLFDTVHGAPGEDPVKTWLVKMMRKPADSTGQSDEGSPARGWESGQIGFEQARRVAAVMHAHSLASAIGAARSNVFAGVRQLMDVGGGSGIYAVAAAQRHPELHATVLELPAMCEAARAYIEDGDVGGRVETAAVDMWREPWPEGHDALFFSNIFHDWNREQNLELTRKALAVLPTGGRIILHEQLLHDTQDGPRTVASFSVMMLRTAWGKQYSFPELREILETAGFSAIAARHSCGYYSLVTARKP